MTLPYALHLGMTAHDFWYESPLLLSAYEQNYDTQQKISELQIEKSAWYIGLYVNRAIATSFDKNTHYPQELILYSEQQRAEKEKAMTLEQKQQQIEAEMKAYIMQRD